MPASGDLLPHEIHAHLTTERFGQRIYYIPEVDSTNRLAAELAKDGEPEGTLVVSDFQTAGRGRHERTWVSPAGRNLLFSVILRPEMSPGAVLPVTLACAMSIAETLEPVLSRKTGVKWPNDVFVDDRKICGILSEGSTGGKRVEYVVVGIGINVNMSADEFPAPSELRRPATSCRLTTGTNHERAPLLATVIGGIESTYRDFRCGGFESLVARYDQRLVDRAQSIGFTKDGESLRGTVAGVGGDGFLKIELAGGKRVALNDDDQIEK
jgi:BirA family biotin operon repressor/biotin-[acetyl-CoA-carboxylase] ligase